MSDALIAYGRVLASRVSALQRELHGGALFSVVDFSDRRQRHLNALTGRLLRVQSLLREHGASLRGRPSWDILSGRPCFDAGPFIPALRARRLLCNLGSGLGAVSALPSFLL